MNEKHDFDDASLPAAVLERIDRVCLDFEAAWKEGRSPPIEEYLGETQGPERSRLLRELVLLDLDYRARQGEEPNAEEYEARFPEDRSVIRDAFQHAATDAGGGGGATPRTGLPIPRPRPLPSELGDYELLEVLGDGGMGIVYRARQRSADRIVALKVIRPDRLAAVFPQQREEAIQRMRAEALAAAKLEHDHIVPVFEVGEVEGEPFFSMRYVEGRRLDEVLRDGPLKGREAAGLVEPVARAVHYAHEHGIIHRDLKPRNILLDSARRPYVADFGLATSPEAAQHLTQTGQAIGTLPYMSPQQAQGQAVDRAGDVYSLGATLYELLTGRPPFRAATLAETQRQVIENEPVPPRHLNPAVDRDLETICLKCLEKEPRKRYRTAAELADELVRYQRGEPIQARPITRPTRLWRWCKRNRAVASLGAVSAALLLALAIGGPLVAVEQTSLRRAAEDATGQATWEARRAEDALKRNQALLDELKVSIAEANRQRDRAEANYSVALQAIDRLLTRIGGHQLPRVPHMELISRELLGDALAFFQKLASQQGDDPHTRLDIARAQSRLGRINRLLGHQDKAEQAFTDAIGELEDLAERFPEVPDYRFHLAVSRCDLGTVLWATGRAKQADALVDEGLSLLVALHENSPKEPLYLEALVEANRTRAFLLSHARESQTTSLTGTPNSHRALLLERLQRNRDAIEAYQEAVEWGRRLLQEAPNTVEYAALLASVYDGLGVSLTDSVTDDGRLPQAEAAHREAIKLYERCLSNHPDEPRPSGLLLGLGHAYSNLGNVLDERGRQDEALGLLHKALPVKQRYVDRYPGIASYQSDLAATLNNIASVLLHQNRPAEAETFVRKAIEHERWALAREPKNPTYKRFLTCHYRLLGDACSALGRYTEAVQAYTEAALPVPDVDHDSFSRHVLAVGLLIECVQDARKDERLTAAERDRAVTACLTHARAIRDRMIELVEGPDDAVALSYLLTEHPERALHDYDRAVELMQPLVDAHPDNALYQHCLGSALYRAGSLEEAVEHLEAGNRLSSGADGSNWLYLAMAYWRLDEPVRARMWYDRALEWLRQRPRHSELVSGIANEAAEMLLLPVPFPKAPDRDKPATVRPPTTPAFPQPQPKVENRPETSAGPCTSPGACLPTTYHRSQARDWPPLPAAAPSWRVSEAVGGCIGGRTMGVTSCIVSESCT